ncbi:MULTISPECIES: metal-dependent hydrolase [unclassified Psychrobacillus]|uniref:metal-dependent hydrolase n=1 Tax=unclassified Psychrobacillus TaxID=2636677 RepID=UPI00146AFC6A|nr:MULTISPECIES: metal-dependent hydrolase [unclassified Psychrobacillus]MCM3359945.1 metal-dependent hydrolase [Psychrobacillus sp. MER TA 171]NME07054.1 metal-dependent hydrolase [Psychrobacillus sp. BL-248-WT-3]
MDTGTHIVMGIALGGLAMADPVVTSSSLTTTAVIAGTIIGSQAPDIDTVLKLKNNAIYIRHHRGITHSIPAVLLWPLLISGVLWLIIPEVNWLHLWLWTFLAVFLHVFVDIFNSYGTQALRPFSKKWVALGVINTFDPIIFGFHVLGLLLWMFGFNPVPTFLTMYAIIAIYYILRFAVQSAVKNSVRKTIPDTTEIIVAPTIKFFQWRIAASSETHHYVGRAYGRSITIYDKFEREEIPDSPLVKAALKDTNLSAFTSFSPIYRWEITQFDHIHEVRLIDLRYRSNDYYPFVAVVHLDEDLNIINSYTGWIFSEDKLRKKLDFLPH